MATLPIITGADNPTLRAKAEPITKVTKDVKKIVKDLKDSLRASETSGVGLAGPQVGISKRICLVTMNGRVTCLINPEILWRSDKVDTMEEGCLSLPGVWLPVTRPTEIAIRYWDESGKTQERHLSGFDAKVVQHEVDHLDGVLIVDYQS